MMILKTQKAVCKVYVNPKERKTKHKSYEKENCELVEWRIRMG